MATYIDNVPFSLQIEQQGRAAELVMFSKTERDVSEHTCIIIRENIGVSVLFQSEHEACRLYIEGLECVYDKDGIEGDEDPYLLPSSKQRLLFSHDNFPLIPGDYLIRVVCKTEYYALLRVLPKQITEGQLQVMKEEIEGYLYGLAHEVVQQNNQYATKFRAEVSPSFLANYDYVEKHFKQILSALTNLTINANYTIKKEYALVPAAKLKTTDAKTILHQLKYPHKLQVRKEPTKVHDYNLAENQWLKEIICFFQRELLQLKQIIDSSLEKVKMRELQPFREREFIHLPTFLEKINMLLQALFHIENSHWYSQVENRNTTILSHRMNMDTRYRTMLKWYQKWQNGHSIEHFYSIRWRRTDKLYEIWGFIQFLQVLIQDMHYTPVSGWVFSPSEKKNFHLPTLDSNTKITLHKDNIQIHFFYEGDIPLDAAETSEHDQPLYTESVNNRPDMRMDIYVDHVYMGSLLFDFKYRPLHHIWDVTKIKKKTATMRKLSQYALSCKSNYLFGTPKARYIRPVHEVWAIHPNVHNNYPVSKKLENHDLRIVQLTPNHDKGHIAENLTAAIREIALKQNIVTMLTV